MTAVARPAKLRFPASVPPCDVVLLLEDFRCLGGEGSGGVGTRDGMDGCKC